MTLPPARPPTRADPDRDDDEAGPSALDVPAQAPGKPTPVRGLHEVEARAAESPVGESVPEEGEQRTESLVFQDGPARWTVTVAGKVALAGQVAGAGRRRGDGLLLLRFDSEDGPAHDPREGWAVGAGLAEIGAEQIRSALRASRPWSAGVPRGGFFEEFVERRGR